MGSAVEPADSVSGPKSVRGPEIVPETGPIQETPLKADIPAVDSGASTIEKSRDVENAAVPAAAFPLLIPPGQNIDSAVEGIRSIAKSMHERLSLNFLFNLAVQYGEIVNRAADKWAETNRKIAEEDKKQANSTAQRRKDELRIKGDPTTGIVSGTLTPTAANAQAVNPARVGKSGDDLLIASTRLEKLTKNADIPQKEVFVPLTFLIVLSKGMAMGKLDMQNEAHDQIAKLVQQLQPLSQLSQEDLLPLINLFVMPLIYFRALDSTARTGETNEEKNFAKQIENFAKDVMKMMGDPTFALLSIVNKMQGTDSKNKKSRNQLIIITKLVLASVALSLLYSLATGTTQGDKYWGVTPEEFRALLKPDPEGKPFPDPSKPMTERETLCWNLIQSIKQQLNQLDLPTEQRDHLIDALLSFLEKKHKMSALLAPANVVSSILESIGFKPPSSPLSV